MSSLKCWWLSFGSQFPTFREPESSLTYSLKTSNSLLWSHLNPAHNFVTYISKIHFNITLLSTLGSFPTNILFSILSMRVTYLNSEFIRGHRQGSHTCALVGKKLNFCNHLCALADLSSMLHAEAGPQTSSSALCSS